MTVGWAGFEAGHEARNEERRSKGLAMRPLPADGPDFMEVTW